MNTIDYTITSPLAVVAKESRPLLAVTIAWHPDVSRIGEQFIGSTEEGVIEISRFIPMFRKTQGESLPIGHGGVSREAMRVVRDTSDGVTICPPKSRMVVELNGQIITDPICLSAEQIETGAIIALGRAVYLCIHWMRCLPKDNGIDGFIGVGSSAIMARDLIRLAAASDSSVLLLGETGTGKEVAARGIHQLSKRAGQRMVSVNMAALNESLAAADLFGASKGAYTGAQTARTGFFAEAEGSTLFLDEIGNTPSSIQPMLLRVLETGEYRPLGATRDNKSNARLITATDQDLYHSSFNHALVRRLESFIIRIPPLRARREDIGLLMVHILNQHGSGTVDASHLPANFIDAALNYDWPGNIRQLGNVLKRAALSLQMGEVPVLANMIETPRLQSVENASQLRKIQAPQNIEDVLAAASKITSASATPIERKKLRDLSEEDVISAMEKHAWTIQYAAEDLGISRPSMYKLIESNKQIRRVEQIPADELRSQFDNAAGEVEKCASLLKTPSEALRRHLKGLGWIA
ncbi:sigma 54-interacting transcriptional regulator [Undibacterium cyanobacteriorum]|uniref:Sigma 54-interacting transcriptional regulator n=1 Tax=Undibacterium cyanobacteriorum TaxID=3073561 RepID=A0ABY9RHN6_9BURK|nr:sigma 54-interacting transcriptional regulator [Undibacterium sp. 20NA77.5]WMW79795.1 sigma 54-interacting transcriptional regulator [Undibacterium sp. 20NA77.5]